MNGFPVYIGSLMSLNTLDCFSLPTFPSRMHCNIFFQEVKLNKAENAWKPSVKDNKKDVDPKETEIQELRRKSLAILN